MQSPPHVLNTETPVVDCSRVTTVLASNSVVQVPLVKVPLSEQLMPAGELVTRPPPAEPLPAAIVRRCGAAVNPAVATAFTLLTTGIVQLVPMQAPVNPSKLDPALPPPISITFVPAANSAVQVPLVTPAALVHEMPDGELVTLPEPVPVP